MSALKFKMLELHPLIEHALKAKSHRPTYEQSFEEVNGEFVEKINLKVGPALHFAKDYGAYLMSNGALGEGETADSLGIVVYAEGTNPESDSDWHETTRALCGADDFVENIPIEWLKEAITKKHQYVEILLTDETMELKSF